MFDKFGEFDSAEELNAAAKGFLDEGDYQSLKALAKENGLDKEDAEDYINGIIPELASTSAAAIGRMDVQQEKLIDTKKNQVERMPLQVIMTMLRGMCTSEEMAAAVMKKGKRFSDIYDAMTKEAKKHASGNMGIACGTDRELCEIIKAYYLETDSAFRKKLSDLYQ